MAKLVMLIENLRKGSDSMKTIQDVFNGTDKLAKAISDLSLPITEEIIKKVISRTKIGIKHRSINNVKEMDLLSFLFQLYTRGALISIEYSRKRTKEIHNDQRKIFPGNVRCGKIIGLKSNERTFAFSVVIQDYSIAQDGGTGEKIGVPRTFIVVDDHGRIRPLKIKVRTLDKEAHFAGEGEQELLFETPVHPQRKQSFFGHPYYLLKLLDERLSEDLRSEGFALNCSGECNSKEHTETISVETMKARVIVPNFFFGKRAALIIDSRKVFDYWRPMIRFIIRADEFAYFIDGDDIWLPWWLRGLNIQSEGDECFVDFGSGILTWRRVVNQVEIASR